MYYEEFEEYEELEHHGIEGQRWGVKNGPPYPLSRNKKNAKAIRKRLERNNREAAEYVGKSTRAYNKVEKDAINRNKMSREKYEKLMAKAREATNEFYDRMEENAVLVKEAQKAGFEVIKDVATYDTRSKFIRYATGGIGGAIGAAANYAGSGGVKLPTYRIKVPK